MANLLLICPSCNHKWLEETTVKDDGSPKELAELWNSILGSRLPSVMGITDARKTKCKLRLRERPISEWRKVFEKMATTPFLLGSNRDGWTASFDWIISNQDNSLKVLEGRYDGKSGHGESKPKPGQYAGF